jgi:hypothetical protein
VVLLLSAVVWAAFWEGAGAWRGVSGGWGGGARLTFPSRHLTGPQPDGYGCARAFRRLPLPSAGRKGGFVAAADVGAAAADGDESGGASRRDGADDKVGCACVCVCRCGLGFGGAVRIQFRIDRWNPSRSRPFHPRGATTTYLP